MRIEQSTKLRSKGQGRIVRVAPGTGGLVALSSRLTGEEGLREEER